jgi:hypothetical protein
MCKSENFNTCERIYEIRKSLLALMKDNQPTYTMTKGQYALGYNNGAKKYWENIEKELGVS